MKRIFIFLALLFTCLAASADVQLPEGKEIYIPKDLQGINLQDSASRWSYHRMACTENFVIFWEKGFGCDLACPPPLDGEPMAVDIDNLEDKLERFYAFFRDTLQFVRKDSKSERYRMMVMLCYSLEGTAYGGDYDQVIGALWITPNRVQDKRLNCIAHELGHCFQSQVSCDGDGDAWGGSGFFEMTSQWMLWHVNPNWIADEEYHWQAFKSLTHKAFLHLENIYHSPYIIEYWSQKHGQAFIADLFRAGKKGDDPVMTYKQLTAMSQKEFCDEMFDASCRIVNLDFAWAHEATRPYANRWKTPTFVDAGDGWQRIATEDCPENYGFNVIALPVPHAGETVSAEFVGEAGADGYNTVKPDCAGWRYGIVAVYADGRTVYGEMADKSQGRVQFKFEENVPQNLWLVVMGAPTEHWKNPGDIFDDDDIPMMKPEDGERADEPVFLPEPPRREREKKPDAQWPYRIKISVLP